MASSSHLAFRVNCCLQRPSGSDNFHRLKTSLSSTFKPFLRELEQLSSRIDVSKAFFKNTSLRLLDVFVDSMFEFVDQPLLPSQSNFAPVDELKETVLVTSIEGKVPNDFPEGVYLVDILCTYPNKFSADGKRLVHKVDLKFNRCSLTHDIGLTRRYNVIMDFPLTLDIQRLLKGGPLIKYDKAEYARIGIMPRYGDADSIKWFQVESSSTFHLLNCFEDGYQVVVRACRALDSIIPGPDMGVDKFEWFSRRLKQVESVDEYSSDSEDGSLFSRCYEWRLNMKTGDVKERYLTGTDLSMDFPMINGDFTGVKNKYGYTQVIDCSASSDSGMAKYGGLAKLHFEEPDADQTNSKDGEYEELIKVDYHKFEQNTFCTGAAFVPKPGSHEEDDGWTITFVHNEDTNMSKAYIIDTKRFTREPVAKITLPCRVPYEFHGAFMPILLGNLTASEY